MFSLSGTKMRNCFIILATLLNISCAETNIQKDHPDINPNAPTPIINVKTIEYRVNGSVNAAAIRYVSPTEGTVLINTTLPWVGQSKTNEDTFFVYLAAQDVGSGLVELDLQVQVFVDGRLFREAVTRGFLTQAVVSGTFTK